MRVETTTRTLYSFEELSEDAKAHAVEKMRAAQYEWTCQDIDDLSAIILYGIADKFQSPGFDEYGSGDFPGIRGWQVDEWDLYRMSISGSGTLTTDNAPGLPWPEGCDYARTGRANREWTGNDFDVWLSNADGGTEWMADSDREDVAAFREAYEDALRAGMEAAQAEADYVSSEEYTLERLADMGEDFTEDGDW